MCLGVINPMSMLFILCIYLFISIFIYLLGLGAELDVFENRTEISVRYAQE